MSDLINRQDAIDALHDEIVRRRISEDTNDDGALDEFDAEAILRRLPSAQPAQRWVPFVLRPTTDEEKEVFPDLDYFLDGKLPEDGQRIMITVRLAGHEEVQTDEFYSDADGSYLDGQYEIGTEAVAWMPMPAPFEL